MKYHLDHPQIKRTKSWGNGNTPKQSKPKKMKGHLEHPQIKSK